MSLANLYILSPSLLGIAASNYLFILIFPYYKLTSTANIFTSHYTTDLIVLRSSEDVQLPLRNELYLHVSQFGYYFIKSIL